METYIKTYNSAAEASQDIRTAETREAWKEYAQNMDCGGWAKWAGETLSAALTKLSEGDAAAAAKIKAQGDIIAPRTHGRANRLENAVVGCIPNVPAYLKGLPKQMQRVCVEYRQKPVISVYVESCIADGTDTKKAARAAATIANVIAATEAAGVRVNLYAAMCSQKNANVYGMFVRLKAAEAPLNLFNVAFALTSRAMCRSVFLRWMETHVEEYVSGYGRPMSAKEIEERIKPNGVVLSVHDMIDNDSTVDDVASKVNAFISGVDKK